MKMEPAGKNAKRIVAKDGSVIGFALELANGRWAPFDKDSSKRLVDISISFRSPKDVFAFFKAADIGGEANG